MTGLLEDGEDGPRLGTKSGWLYGLGLGITELYFAHMDRGMTSFRDGW